MPKSLSWMASPSRLPLRCTTARGGTWTSTTTCLAGPGLCALLLVAVCFCGIAGVMWPRSWTASAPLACRLHSCAVRATFTWGPVMPSSSTRSCASWSAGLQTALRLRWAFTISRILEGNCAHTRYTAWPAAAGPPLARPVCRRPGRRTSAPAYGLLRQSGGRRSSGNNMSRMTWSDKMHKLLCRQCIRPCSPKRPGI